MGSTCFEPSCCVDKMTSRSDSKSPMGASKCMPWQRGRLDGGMHMSVTCSPLKTEIREDLN